MKHNILTGRQMGGKKFDLQNNILDLNAGGTDKTTWELDRRQR